MAECEAKTLSCATFTGSFVILNVLDIQKVNIPRLTLVEVWMNSVNKYNKPNSRKINFHLSARALSLFSNQVAYQNFIPADKEKNQKYEVVFVLRAAKILLG